MATVPTIRGQINSRYEMRRAGYKFSGAAKCKACDAPVEWWLTNKGNNATPPCARRNNIKRRLACRPASRTR